MYLSAVREGKMFPYSSQEERVKSATCLSAIEDDREEKLTSVIKFPKSVTLR
jgi:hypothetical protein